MLGPFPIGVSRNRHPAVAAHRAAMAPVASFAAGGETNAAADRAQRRDEDSKIARMAGTTSGMVGGGGLTMLFRSRHVG